jgi:hypothetical protein
MGRETEPVGMRSLDQACEVDAPAGGTRFHIVRRWKRKSWEIERETS